MLTEHIIHECVKRLLGNLENPEEVIKCLCQILRTVGQLLNVPTACAHISPGLRSSARTLMIVPGCSSYFR